MAMEGDEDLGRRAEVLAKVADQLSEKLALERKANRELRILASEPEQTARRPRARRLGAVAVAAAAVSFVVPVVVFWARASAARPRSAGATAAARASRYTGIRG
jgi:hypothetical protein